jgi:hypothetical protein
MEEGTTSQTEPTLGDCFVLTLSSASGSRTSSSSSLAVKVPLVLAGVGVSAWDPISSPPPLANHALDDPTLRFSNDLYCDACKGGAVEVLLVLEPQAVAQLNVFENHVCFLHYLLGKGKAVKESSLFD